MRLPLSELSDSRVGPAYEDKHPQVTLTDRSTRNRAAGHGAAADGRRRPMTSTRTRNLARAIQRANPDMKYTEALRHAEAGRIVIDPKGSNDALIDLCRAAGMDATPIDLSAQRSDEPLDPTSISLHFPLRSNAEVPFDPNGDALPLGDPEPERERLGNYVDRIRPVYDLRPALWDGKTHPDPLTFLVGQDLRTGEEQHVTLKGATPHVMISGASATGKTSLAEIIAAQALVRPMPWDSSLRGSVVIVDPKGTLAHRWAGRPGVTVANGYEAGAEPDADGNPVTGPLVMAAVMEWIENEYQRRTAVLAQHKNAGTWVGLPDEVKREERLAPMIVLLDEFLDYVNRESRGRDDLPAKTKAANRRRAELFKKEKDAREKIINLADRQVRKYRHVGIHTIVTSQALPEGTLGSSFASNLPVRVMTGRVSNAKLKAAFVGQHIPKLPTVREAIEDNERKTERITGRARIVTGPGAEVEMIQVPWFGGTSNDQALNKWLPRGAVPPNGVFSLPAGKPRGASTLEG